MSQLNIVYVPVGSLNPAPYNPRKWSEAQTKALKESIVKYGMVDPVLCNSTPERLNTVIGGHFRLKIAKELGYKEVPVVYIDIPDTEKEKELNVRLNKNLGEFDFTLLKDFGEEFLGSVGFSTEELDNIFAIDPIPEFDLKKELDKLNIKEVKVQHGDRYEIDGSILMCGDSTVEDGMLKLMEGVKADMVMTDPPYILDYLRGKTKQKDGVTEGFGLKKNRKYLGTDVLPDNFTELWMTNVAKVQKPDFSIMIFEHPKNLRTIWNELEKHWRYRNTVTWHVPNRVQGFAAKSTNRISRLSELMEIFLLILMLKTMRSSKLNMKMRCLLPRGNLTLRVTKKARKSARLILLNTLRLTRSHLVKASYSVRNRLNFSFHTSRC